MAKQIQNEQVDNAGEIQTGNAETIAKYAETIAGNVEAEIAEPEVLRRSRRERWFSIPDDYHVYQVDTDSDIGEKDDLTLVKQAMQSVNSTIWKEAIYRG